MRGYWLLKAIGSVVLWSFFLWADPFGVETASDRNSLDLFQRVYSPHYSRANQDKIFVVLIRDEDLPLQGGGPPAWPPAYDHYVALLKVLGGEDGLKPAAVFLDILFENAPDGVDDINELCNNAVALEANGTPVLFAVLPDLFAQELPVPSALKLCDEEMTNAAVGWRADAGLYPFSAEAGNAVMMTAASALYEIAIENDEFDDPDRLAGLQADIRAGNSLRTVWGATAPPGAGCKNYRGRFMEKIGFSARILIDGLAPHRASRKDFEYVQPCAYHEIVSAKALISASPEEKAIYAAIMDGAYVFVGADVRGIPDFVDSPVHGLLPGVFLHAMALDNMMTLGGDYLRDPPVIGLPLGSFGIGVDVILQTVLLLALALLLAFARSPGPSVKSAPREDGDCFWQWVSGFAANSLYFVLFSIIVLGVASYAFFVMRWTPLNYGGLLLAGAAMIFSRPFVESAFRRRKLAN